MRITPEYITSLKENEIFVLMIVQVLSEEKRLRRDFGEEYEAYCKRTGRFLIIK